MSIIPPFNCSMGSITEQKQALTTHFFQGVDTVKKVIDAYKRSFQNAFGNVGIQRTANGVTGATYMCQLDVFDVDETIDLDLVLEFVLKWQPERLCLAEQLGGRVFQLLGFETPKIYPLTSSEGGSIVRSAQGYCENLASLTNNDPLLAIEKIQAGNLEAYFKNGRIRRLSLEDKQTLIKQFGEILAVDLFIGNDDRFVSFEPNERKPFLDRSVINMGNVLVKISEEGGNAKLKGVFPIDNCPSLSLIEKEYVEEEELCGFGMFNEDDYTVEETELEESDSVELARSSSKIEERVVGFNRTFEVLVRDVDRLCLQFIKALKFEIHELNQNPAEYADLIEMVPTLFKAGLLDGFKKIRAHQEDLLVLLKQSPDPIDQPARLMLKNLETLMR